MTKEEILAEIQALSDEYEAVAERGRIVIDVTGILFNNDNNEVLIPVLQNMYRATVSIFGTSFSTNIERLGSEPGRELDLEMFDDEGLREILSRVRRYIDDFRETGVEGRG